MSSSSSAGPPPPPLRRIVTGHNPQGLGTISIDEPVQGEDASQPGLRGGSIWTTDSAPSKDTNNNVDGSKRVIRTGIGFVMPNGTNLRFTDLAPGATAPMHRTSSIDYNILISGKLIIITDDGSHRLVENPGDVVVQRGNMHAWRNPGPEWTRWISVLVDAEPAIVKGQPAKEAWMSDLSKL